MDILRLSSSFLYLFIYTLIHSLVYPTNQLFIYTCLGVVMGWRWMALVVVVVVAGSTFLLLSGIDECVLLW